MFSFYLEKKDIRILQNTLISTKNYIQDKPKNIVILNSYFVYIYNLLFTIICCYISCVKCNMRAKSVHLPARFSGRVTAVR